MRHLDRLDRRMFVKQLGRTTLGLVILGSATVACASEQEGQEPRPGGATPPPDEPDPGGSEPSGSGPAAAAGWRTVDLGFVAAYVRVRQGEAVVVDTGVSGSEDAVEAVLREAGSGWGDVSDVILTHRHPDHVGSVPAVLTAATEARGHAGTQDLPAITAPRELAGLAGGEVVAGLRIVATPGHTAGHISVLDPDAAVLVAGDALNGDGSGRLAGPNPEFTQDLDRAWESVSALAALDVDLATILPGHGGAVSADASAQLRALADGPRT